MRLTKKNSPKSYTIYYLPQEIKETMVTEVSYLPITRERLEQFFKAAFILQYLFPFISHFSIFYPSIILFLHIFKN